MLMLASILPSKAQQTPFEKSASKNVTATYPEIIDWYTQLAKTHNQIKVIETGITDIGKPLHLIVLSKDRIFDPAEIKRKNKRVLFINNGIHPGEPEGIDASMMLVRDLLRQNKLPKDVVVCMIAVYNIDGCLNRGASRVNQNGPESYGFRGNYQNLDLNRDFIKTDSKNSRSFQEIVQQWKPDVFWDNHTSNGADYQYVMTLIETQKDKLQKDLSAFMHGKFTPELYRRMKKDGYEMIPYVNPKGDTPDKGIDGFPDLARYSTGYMALHNVFGYMPETHMLKPFAKRVESTYIAMKNLIDMVQEHSAEIAAVKLQADKAVSEQKTFALNWELDEKDSIMIPFKGFEAKYKPSEVSGLKRLHYDRSKPFEKKIPYKNSFKPTVTVEKPVAYIIPQSWEKVIERLKWNRVKLEKLKADKKLKVEVYTIADYKTSPRPFEGHYVHSEVQLTTSTQIIQYYKDDYIIYTNQPVNRYIVETLEPQGADSFFTWGFFDSILGAKEHFSNYVFEDDAADFIAKNPDIKKQLEEAKAKDPKLAASAEAQLQFVYERSPWMEKTYKRYPVGRILK